MVHLEAVEGDWNTNVDELLTVDEVARLLKLSRYQTYELAKPSTRSGLVRHYPLPSPKIGKSIRFRRSDINEWLTKLSGLRVSTE